jgi:molybdate transport system ATP-binding protein
MEFSVRLRKQFDGFLLDAEWRSDAGVTVLFGCSGAGKSLTLQMIAGLLRPDEGSIMLDGHPLFDRSRGVDLPPQRRNLGYLFQDLALFPHMTVRETVIYGAAGLPRGETRYKAEEMLKRFRIGDLADKRPGEISGGQRQRVALARALIRGPRALLLDEPFSALDLPLRRDMRRLLKTTQQESGIPVLLVTHDPEDVRDLAGAIVVYAGGRAVRSGTAAELLAAQSADPSRELLRDCGQETGCTRAGNEPEALQFALASHTCEA